MAKLEITLEKTQRICKVVEATEDQIKQLLNGENPFFDELEKDLTECHTSYDYTVHDEDGKCLVDWD